MSVLRWVHLSGELPGDLLNVKDDEFGGFERGEANDDIHNAAIDIGLGGGGAVAPDEIGLPGRLALKSTLAEQIVHE